MGRFRKKPVVVHAWPAAEVIRAAYQDWGQIPQPIMDAYHSGGWVFAHDHVSIPTLEGTMRAERADWIICGVSGEFYPCKPDIFAKTYDEVTA